MTHIIIPKIVPHCTGDGCELEAKYTCNKCGTMVCQNIGGIIGDVGMRGLVKKFEGGHAVFCMYCRMTAQPHVYCPGCAGDHELMLSFRGSCRTVFRSLHESQYGNEENFVAGRTHENATDLADRREDKYKKMDSHQPDGAKLIRSKKDQDFAIETEDVVEEGNLVTVMKDVQRDD